MRLLLDTHAFIWWRDESHRFAYAAENAITEADEVFVSMASAWEIAIKTGLGKLRIDADVEQGIYESGFEVLAIEFQHASAVAALPAHHKDPFDRMLIAQARSEHLTVVTHDRRFERYDVPVIWI